jgi:mannose-1-phosphate guanylyltransferase
MVVAETQREYVRQWPKARGSSRVAFQPQDRGTAAGVLFGLVPVLTTDPDAVVLITPSDHGVGDPDTFRRGIMDSVAHVQLHDGVVLFGVEPTTAQTDYGWITLKPSHVSAGVQLVSSFVEKPPPDVARRLLKDGAVWNTMVVVARARTLLDLCRQHLRELAAVFAASVALPKQAREAFLAARYPRLEAADFSRNVLTPAAGLLAYTWPASVGWTDLGTPERLQSWLRAAPLERAPIKIAPPDAARLDAWA